MGRAISPILFKNMRIEYTEGCICYGLDVDGKPFHELGEVSKVDILHSVINVLSCEYDPQSILIDLLRQYGEYEYHYTCEDCGDSVTSYTLEI